ncbi:hypothetical protein BD560DRAFT_433985 [Blakeslea trispora]|nr:hypothetical protein BD560DRAFT_433985 [Blakeslea trispora]
MSARNKTVNNNNSWDLDAMLAQEIQDLNKDSAEDRRVKEAVIVSKPDPNRINGQLSEDSSSDDSDYEDDLAIRDPELFKITESNRQIHVDTHSPKDKLSRRPAELVFSDPPLLVSRDDFIHVSFHYGLTQDSSTKSKPKRYMLMCDFGEESMYALQWAIGTLLRNGDEVHVASVVNLDEEIEDMDQSEKYSLWAELDRHSKTMISRVKTIMVDMLLFNIKIDIYSLAGKTRESLLNLIYETPQLTMVVCGSREKSALRGMIMGSVSTFLVHNSPVPVSVVRPQKKERSKKHKKKTAAQKLSQSVMNGHLKVDEAEEKSLSLNSYDGSISL